MRKRPTSYGIIAQLGEHLPYKQGVIGSSPIGPILQHLLGCKNLIVELQNVMRASHDAHSFYETGASHIEAIHYGGIAQLARAHGSYPWCRWFKSSSRYLRRTSERMFFFCWIVKRYLNKAYYITHKRILVVNKEYCTFLKICLKIFLIRVSKCKKENRNASWIRIRCS